MTSDFNLAQPFYENSLRNPEGVALFVGEARLTYRELATLARRVSAWLGPASRAGLAKVGILASRSLEAYAGVLGTLWSGAAYVPINPHTPEDRLVRILQMTGLDALVADQSGLDLLSNRVLECAPGRILFGPGAKPPQNALEFPGVRFDSLAELAGDGPDRPVALAEDALAYIIFTSGSTGTPKGVMIEAGSVAAFRAVVQERCRFQPTDRVSQVAELTFDNSVLDLFVTWAAGAAVYVVPASLLMAPARFIREHELTIWFSVPSTACFMERMKMLKPGAFPTLRCSIFAGEALPVATAQAWQRAAPNSVVENFYGPTEVTVDCIAQRLDDPPNVTRNRGSLAIGKPFPGIQAGIVDANLRFLGPDEEGELVVSGRQLARGYYLDPELTAARFPTLEGRRWYRTGDLAYQDASGAFHHLGRIDNQVKILGNRVELEEVEAHLRTVSGTQNVAAIAWPIQDGIAGSIVGFTTGATRTGEELRDALRLLVPPYMVPRRIIELDTLPLGSSGKIDRRALARYLDEPPGGGGAAA
ncbi:MAG TPA: amino acid adenylation domain-containing protein [Bryobacteraceae bacterium]|nr:amino acid adenylation domain-containing protein [Bryobacteraceae bacterium]